MGGKEEKTAAPFVPKGADLSTLRESVQGCRGCGLYLNATQAVFGDGPEGARLVLVGEKPGDREDIEGKPFVGPAGKLLHKGMEKAGIDPGGVYITNAVKHFKFENRGGRRLHKKPTGPEIAACRPWLEAELDLIRPSIVLCLGATAAQTLLGSGARVTRLRGKFLKRDPAGLITATLHPSALLRVPEKEQREEAYRRFVEDLVKVRQRLEGMEHR